MKIEIWSDIACPWCYIGKVRFEKALSAYEHADDVAVEWRSFQLQPDAPRDNPVLTAAHLAEKYGVGLSQAHEMMSRVTQVAAEEGLEFRLDKAVAANTFDAHRLVHHAASKTMASHGTVASPAEPATAAASAAEPAPTAAGADDLGVALMWRLMHAYQAEGANVADHETLLRLAAEVGLERGEAASVLTGDAHAADVRADLARGRGFGVNGVPFFVIDEQHGISGAQPSEFFLRALRQLGPKQQQLTMLGSDGDAGNAGDAGDAGDAAAVCDDDGCAVPR